MPDVVVMVCVHEFPCRYGCECVVISANMQTTFKSHKIVWVRLRVRQKVLLIEIAHERVCANGRVGAVSGESCNQKSLANGCHSNKVLANRVC